jgi:hypothetical protein
LPERARRTSCSSRSTHRANGRRRNPGGRATFQEAPGSRLLAFADAIFGIDGPERPEPRRWALRVLAVAALLAAIVVARRPDAAINPQFWGEDGFLYFRDNLTLGFPRAAQNLYMDFPQLGQRIVAFIGGLVPIAAAPRAYTTVSITLTALCLATFVLPAFRHLVRSDALRVLWCIAAAALPFEMGAPPVQFPGVLSNPANLGWWVGIWLSLLSLMRLPPQSLRIGLLALGGCLAIFTTPLASACAPLWILRAWRASRRSDRRELGFALSLVAALAVCVALTGNLGSNRGLHLSFLEMPGVYLLKYVMLVSDRVAALVLRPGALATVRAAGTGAVAGVALGVLAALVTGSLRAQRRTLPAFLAALYLYFASLLLTILGRLFWVLMALHDFPPRYTLVPAAMLVLAVVIALDGMPRGLARTAAVLGVIGLLGWSWSPRFVVSPLVDQHWPRYAVLLEQKLRAGSTAPLSIPMNPPWTPLRFDVRPLAPNPPVPPSQILASVGPDETFRQTFVSECDGLDGITLRIADEDSPQPGALDLALVDDERQNVLASVTIARDQLLQGAPQPLYVPPIATSAGRRYAIVARAVEIDPRAPIRVLGAANDSYPDGFASFAGATPGLDASFAYSCASRQTAATR